MAKINSNNSNIAYKVLIEPWITEETTRLAQFNKYVFKVGKDSDKDGIKRSIESLYSVSVNSVNTVTIPKKPRFRKQRLGWKSGYKKAIVTVKEGDKIDIFANS